MDFACLLKAETALPCQRPFTLTGAFWVNVRSYGLAT